MLGSDTRYGGQNPIQPRGNRLAPQTERTDTAFKASRQIWPSPWVFCQAFPKNVDEGALYPWEKREDAEETISFARRMFTSGLLDTLQATIVVPYPGTPLFDEARRNNWLTTEDWDDYDMKQSVWKSPVTNEDVLEFTRGLYKAALNPAFILRKMLAIRSIDDMKFLFRAGEKVFSHMADFKTKSVD